MSESVDLVYLWVNGSDPEWIKKYQLAKKTTGVNYSDTDYFRRYVEKNELLLSLRTVYQFMLWINKIYIVTNDQYPFWLNLSHPKISIISHSQLYGEGKTSFSSNSIQFTLNKIPNLANKFILADDDFFWTKPIDKSYYFTKNKLKFRILRFKGDVYDMYGPDATCTDDDDNIMVFHKSIIEAWNLVKSKRNKTKNPRFGYSHVAIPLSKEIFEEIFQEYNISHMKDIQFRKCGMVQFQSLFLYHAYATGRLVKTHRDYYTTFRGECSEQVNYLLKHKSKGASYCFNNCMAQYFQQLIDFYPPCEYELKL